MCSGTTPPNGCTYEERKLITSSTSAFNAARIGNVLPSALPEVGGRTLDTAVPAMSFDVNVLTLLGGGCNVTFPVPAGPEPFADILDEPVCAYVMFESAGAESCVMSCAAPLSVIGVLLAAVAVEPCELASAWSSAAVDVGDVTVGVEAFPADPVDPVLPDADEGDEAADDDCVDC